MEQPVHQWSAAPQHPLCSEAGCFCDCECHRPGHVGPCPEAPAVHEPLRTKRRRAVPLKSSRSRSPFGRALGTAEDPINVDTAFVDVDLGDSKTPPLRFDESLLCLEDFGDIPDSFWDIEDINNPEDIFPSMSPLALPPPMMPIHSVNGVVVFHISNRK